jgi:hypothetical protein
MLQLLEPAQVVASPRSRLIEHATRVVYETRR